MERFSLSIIIPVFRAEDTIQPLVRGVIQTYRAEYDLDVVLIDDRSPDQSAKRCLELHEEFPDIVQFHALSKNAGEHNAVMAGLAQATGEAAVIMDDDFQNPIESVAALVKELRSGEHDAVYSRYAVKQHSWLRNLGSWFHNRVANFMLRKPPTLYLSSFKILNRFLIDRIVPYDLPFAYIDGLVLRLTDRIGTVEVPHDKRSAGTSGYTPLKLISLWLTMFTSFSIAPLRASVLAGFILSGIGFLFGVQTAVEKYMNPALPLGWASIVFLVSVFSGAQLIAIGLLGEYLGRLFLFVGKKPQYIIRKSYSKKPPTLPVK